MRTLVIPWRNRWRGALAGLVRSIAAGAVLGGATFLHVAGGAAPVAAQLATGSVVVSVLDDQDEPVLDATVELTWGPPAHPSTRQVVVDEEGQVTLPGLDPGVYVLRVSAEGFEPAEHATVTVRAGQPTIVQVRLSAEPGETVAVTAALERRAARRDTSENV
jgi:hypothetical protein